jgi:bifunctional UDP-N-acetylglucosamine pyrophosphorylase/glucosamine-1-phosphate N-acetyltransferase
MGELTRERPKPLLTVHGRSLIEWKLERLPETVHEIVLVVGYQGEQIKETFGNEFKGRKIVYVEDQTLTGTAHALWQAQGVLEDRFLVMMGDDIYDARALEAVTGFEYAVAGFKASRLDAGTRILRDESGCLKGFASPARYRETHADGGLAFTGLYSLTKDIFAYEPVKLETKEEWGLPQTLLLLAEERPVHIVETDSWLQITSPEDLARAEAILK